ncbi:hypothetical protein FSP39_009796 [Pinctada imbricata]|uniref:C2H2-type domain-containing protein n=1 Tax=Pinctada imbricata TaxID=66713 RepID=A0AA89BX69_PINIB|nr:hypothetical protein FSP39_009796 [Pinctada imbricata]
MQKHKADKLGKKHIRDKERQGTMQKHQTQRTTHKPMRPMGNRCRLRTAICHGNSIRKITAYMFKVRRKMRLTYVRSTGRSHKSRFSGKYKLAVDYKTFNTWNQVDKVSCYSDQCILLHYNSETCDVMPYYTDVGKRFLQIHKELQVNFSIYCQGHNIWKAAVPQNDEGELEKQQGWINQHTHYSLEFSNEYDGKRESSDILGTNQITGKTDDSSKLELKIEVLEEDEISSTSQSQRGRKRKHRNCDNDDLTLGPEEEGISEDKDHGMLTTISQVSHPVTTLINLDSHTGTSGSINSQAGANFESLDSPVWPAFESLVLNTGAIIDHDHSYARTALESQDSHANTTWESQDSHAKTTSEKHGSCTEATLKSQDSQSKTRLKSQDSHAKKTLKSQDSHVKKTLKSQDSHVKKTLKSQDSHVKRTLKSQDSHVKKTLKSQDSHVKKTLKSQDSYAKKTLKSQDSHVKKTLKSRSLHAKRRFKNQDSHAGRRRCADYKKLEFQDEGSTDFARPDHVSSFKIHGLTKTVDPKMCLVCKKNFRSKYCLQQHARAFKHEQVTEEETDFQCYVCKKYFSDAWFVQFHWETTGHILGNQKYFPDIASKVCIVCNTKFSSIKGLNTHIQIKNHEQICSFRTEFHCKECNKYFLRQWDLCMHSEQTGHIISPIFFRFCIKCDETFSSSDTFEQHVQKCKHEQISEEKTDFQCVDCRNFFISSWDLEIHKKLGLCENPSHLKKSKCCSLCKIPLDSGSNDTTELGKCEACESSFSIGISENHLIQSDHSEISDEEKTGILIMEVEEGGTTSKSERAYAEEYLNASGNFKEEGSISSHENCEVKENSKHSIDIENAEILNNSGNFEEIGGIKLSDSVSYACVVCQKKIKTKTSLRNHVRYSGHEQISSKETKFHCNKCLQFFISSWDLILHTYHFKCRAGNCLKVPYRVPRNEFHCMQCNSRYFNEKELQQHIAHSKHERFSHEETDFRCLMCGKYLMGKWNMIFHTTNGIGHVAKKRPSNCRDNRKCGDRGNLVCSVCRIEFDSLPKLRSHIDSNGHQQISDEKTDFRCSECKLYFVSKWDLCCHLKSSAHFMKLESDDLDLNVKMKKSESGKQELALYLKENYENLCLHCNKYFTDDDAFLSHILWYFHEEECTYKTDFKCYTCGKYYFRNSDLICHMTRTRHSGKWQHEERKIIRFSDKEAKENLGHLYKCSVCKETLRNFDAVEEHLEVSLFCGQSELYKCPIEGCWNEHFSSINSQQVHIVSKHKGAFPFKCKECPLVFFNARNFNSHLLKHKYEIHPNRSARTAESKKQQLDIMKLQRKIRGVNDKDAVIPDKLDVPQTCLICSEKFDDYYNLRIHVIGSGHEQIVSEETRFKCFTCDSNFVKFADLEIHMDMTSHRGNPIRTGERKIEKVNKVKENTKYVYPYRCSLCLRSFQKLETIENHIKAGECIMRWRHKCPCCDIHFRSRNLYEAHMYQCHNYEFPFKCEHEECSLSKFKTVAGYTMHRKSHENIAKQGISNKKMIKCQICDEIFTCSTGLAYHRKKMHSPSRNDVHRVIEESQEETIYRCFSCDTYYKNRHDLRLHMKQTNHHGLPDQEKDIHLESAINDGREITRCSRCLFIFKNMKKAKHHIRSAACKITFQRKCPLCKTSFFSLNSYEVHLKENCSSHDRRKDQDEELICEQCGFQTQKRRELYLHMRRMHKTTLRSRSSKQKQRTKQRRMQETSEDSSSESDTAENSDNPESCFDKKLDSEVSNEETIQMTNLKENESSQQIDVNAVFQEIENTESQVLPDFEDEEIQQSLKEMSDLENGNLSESDQLLFDLLL